MAFFAFFTIWQIIKHAKNEVQYANYEGGLIVNPSLFAICEGFAMYVTYSSVFAMDLQCPSRILCKYQYFQRGQTQHPPSLAICKEFHMYSL